MTTKSRPIDDGQAIRGHVCKCGDCGTRGVFCDTDTGGIVVDCREIYVDLGGLPVLMSGRADGTDTHDVYCESCAN